jgi:hypothetical protein
MEEIVTLKPKTYFEQVPLKVVKKIAKIDDPKEVSARKEPVVTPEKKKTIAALATPSPDFSRLMDSQFDIFQMESGGSVLWQGSAATIEEAKRRVNELQADAAAQYMVVALRTGSKLLISPDGSDLRGGQQPDAARPAGSPQL